MSFESAQLKTYIRGLIGEVLIAVPTTIGAVGLLLLIKSNEWRTIDRKE
jgi:hypothetical protein